jgi:hypothetical protein
MFQLSKGQSVNTIAFYPNELITGSVIQLEYTQSYSKTVSGSFTASVISNPQNTPWVIAQFSGSVLPSASGQYDFNIYELVVGPALVWNTTNINWNLVLSTWNSTSSLIEGELISTDRAIISGSDVTPIKEYLSPNENGAYIVYIG